MKASSLLNLGHHEVLVSSLTSVGLPHTFHAKAGVSDEKRDSE